MSQNIFNSIAKKIIKRFFADRKDVDISTLESEIESILRVATQDEERIVAAETTEIGNSNLIRRFNIKQRAAEKARGRIPKIGDKVQRHRDPIGIITEVGDSWVGIDYNGCLGGAAREYIATQFDYIDE